MALLEAFILEQLLVTCSQYVIHIAERKDGVTGTGYPDDPFNGAGSATDTDPRFDRIMRSLPEGASVKIEPGTYYTNGYNTAYDPDSPTSPKGWRPKNGLRVEGSGPLSTFLKLTNNAPPGLTTAIGCNRSNVAHIVEGCEFSDFAIDASYDGTTSSLCALGGIYIDGRQLRARNIRVFNLGTRGSQQSVGISLAWARLGPVVRPINCIVQSCRVDSPGGTSSGGVVAYALGSDFGSLHYGCVIQDSLADFGTSGPTNNYTAIMAGGGIGTIVERNTFLNAQVGLIFSPQETNDLVVRWNDFQTVTRGVQHVYGTGGDAGPLRRLVFLHNTIGLAGASAAKGVSITANGDGYIVGPLIMRHNLIRTVSGGNAGDLGIELQYSPQNIIERNIIDLPSVPLNNAIVFTNCAKAKTFSNRKLDSTLLPGSRSVETTHTDEWDLEAENLLML